ncbi:fungal-specific transcription factor domain-containing protein [Xylaria bambusicola]|uniref:fungal-specific transcription factor domain-containing protein n=1 Tax=Xylaria bambusicola TaxID=326684 RepID=UPI002008151A|nr:fungal-specific transcription factor domain-containing protein [Xylaria bambusicola]KAI0526635.1 fungal-specific transcription factor domain-containing protein [Xylaria bambusicola]
MSAPPSGPSPVVPAAADPKGTYNPRKRGRTACTRCKHRKQKCDDQWPTCSNCSKAGTECDKSAVSEDEPPAAYTRALEQRIAVLEARLSERVHQQEPDLPQPQTSSIRTQSQNNVLAEAVELLALGNIEAPAYVGASSGLNLALTLGEMVQATVWNKALPFDANGSRSSSTDGSGNSRGARAINRQEMVARSAEPPADEHGTALVNAYLNQPQTRYPFLDEREIWDLHAKRMTLNTTPVQQLTKAERFGLFKLYMVYAIGAMLIQLTERNTPTPPENYYMTALQHLFTARESKTTQNVEAMVLLVLYHIRSSSYGIWYMIGLAMRTCIDLGLHTRRHESNLDHNTIQMRRRLFWSVYSLERTIAICLGRPLSIPDRQIDVDLPLDPEDEAWSEITPTPPVKKRSFSMAIWLFKMRRIESRIQFSIYRADKPLSALTSKMNQLYQDLESWKTSLTERFGDVDLNYPMLHYHRAVRLLIQPFLPLLLPSDPYYLICLRAAGGVCQAHKRLHQSLEYGHSFIAVQHVFVAGITLLYGLWTQQHAIWSYSLSNDIRACSLVLFVMGERAPWVKKYRDAFEVLVNATMEKLENGVNNLAETAAVQMRNVTNSNTDFTTEQFDNLADGEEGDAWKVVAELANWIDQPEGSLVWMPDFELLQNLSPM